MTLVEWMGATWSVDETVNGSARCTVVNAGSSSSGWHVGDHCWLTPEELHPTQDKETGK